MRKRKERIPMKIGFLNELEQKVDEKKDEFILPSESELIFAQNKYVDIDCRKTRRNNNILICGASGAGKTRNIIIPNILQANTSYVIYDPKGKLFKDYGMYLKNRGYDVKNIDFLHPEVSDGYNPFPYIKTERDIQAFADIIFESNENISRNIDPYWDDNAKLVLTAALSFMLEVYSEGKHNFEILNKILCKAFKKSVNEQLTSNEKEIPLSENMNNLYRLRPNSFAVKTWNKVKSIPEKTLNCIVSTAIAKIGKYDTHELKHMMEEKNIDFTKIGTQKTAVFVTVSDIDRSLDALANIFFSQAFQKLIEFADRECENECLPVPVQFIMDDFGTALKLNNFDKMIATIRSRNISAIVCIQAENQLSAFYRESGDTIIINCDTYIYLVSNTSSSSCITDRVDINTSNMKLDECLIVRRGDRPCIAKLFNIDEFKQRKMTAEDKRTTFKSRKEVEEEELRFNTIYAKEGANKRKCKEKSLAYKNEDGSYTYTFISRKYHIDANNVELFFSKKNRELSIVDVRDMMIERNVIDNDYAFLVMSDDDVNKILNDILKKL